MRDSSPTDLSSPGLRPQRSLVRTLTAIMDHARRGRVVLRRQLDCGDQVIVKTRNSVYSLWSLGGDSFAVSGGWFDRQRSTPVTITVNGCTYGGSVIRRDVVAAPGLFLEFGNNVLTTRIQDVRIVRCGQGNGAPTLPC